MAILRSAALPAALLAEYTAFVAGATKTVVGHAPYGITRSGGDTDKKEKAMYGPVAHMRVRERL